jgi:hypothetical protein
MATLIDQFPLKNGTLVQHKVSGYRGRIDGTTAIKSCFTSAGVTLQPPTSKEDFQYRILVEGELIRHIAPARDLQILEEELRERVLCLNCSASYLSKPEALNKAGGRCECGGWICPSCLACQAPIDPDKKNRIACIRQAKRLAKKNAKLKRIKPS